MKRFDLHKRDWKGPRLAGDPLRLGAVVLGAVLLAGCEQSSMDDLRVYAQEVHKRAGGKIEPLPPIKPYNVYTYGAAERKDPFEPFFRQQQEDVSGAPADSGIQPDFNRNKEELESFPLDSLRMVGTLERESDLWAIVLASDSTIHRVQVGNYIGQNHGKIVDIQEDRVDLIEIARDARGLWQERPASIALLEQE